MHLKQLNSRQMFTHSRVSHGPKDLYLSQTFPLCTVGNIQQHGTKFHFQTRDLFNVCSRDWALKESTVSSGVFT